MGNGVICTRVEQFDKGVQMPPIQSTKRRFSTSSSLSQLYKASPPKTTTPPPLLSDQDEGFTVKRNTDQYSAIWDYNAKVSLSLMCFFIECMPSISRIGIILLSVDFFEDIYINLLY